MERKEVVYVSHPIRGDNQMANLMEIRRILADLYMMKGVVPVAPYILGVYALSDSIVGQREMVRETCEYYLASGFVTAMYVYGEEPSRGMYEDVLSATRYKIPVFFMTDGAALAFSRQKHFLAQKN